MSRPGSKWRVLVQLDDERVGLNALELRSPAALATLTTVSLDSRIFKRSTFDELVVDEWLHLEQMSRNVWWMQLGDYRIHVTVGPDGKATDVLIEHEGELATPPAGEQP